MLDITLTPDLKQLEKMLGPKFKKQARFALAVSLTRTVGAVRTELQNSLPEHFTVRSKWVAGSMQTESATKASLQATVGSVQRPGSSLDMSLQAEGGERKAQGGTLAVPIGARKTPTTRTTPAQWPSRLLTRKGYYARPMGQHVGVFRARKRGPDQLWYVLTRTVHVKARWPFEALTQTTVGRVWAQHLERALDDALKTAR